MGGVGSRPVQWLLGCVGLLCVALGCGPVEPEETRCAPEQGWECPSGQVCVDGVCAGAPEALAKCVVGAKRSCVESCAGV
ncbi:MAG TPA: hypothetical protein VGB96_07665, partial [Archangium sp.]